VTITHRYTDTADSPMFSLAPMLPISDVRCANRPNSRNLPTWFASIKSSSVHGHHQLKHEILTIEYMLLVTFGPGVYIKVVRFWRPRHCVNLTTQRMINYTHHKIHAFHEQDCYVLFTFSVWSVYHIKHYFSEFRVLYCYAMPVWSIERIFAVCICSLFLMTARRSQKSAMKSTYTTR